MNENQAGHSPMEVDAGDLECQLMSYLPAIYRDPGTPSHDQEHPQGENAAPQDQRRPRLPFLHYFLLAFEQVLLHRPGQGAGRFVAEASSSAESIPSLEEEIDSLHVLFNPLETPEEFLTWLASWAALSFRPELTLPRRRRLLARIIPLYRLRGTKKYLEELLTLHLDARPSVDDAELPRLQVGLHSTIGQDTYLGGGPPHFFRVRLAFPEKNWPAVGLQRQLARNVIDLAKPAHTDYELEVVWPRMQVGVHCSVGFDTILGA